MIQVILWFRYYQQRYTNTDHIEITTLQHTHNELATNF